MFARAVDVACSGTGTGSGSCSYPPPPTPFPPTSSTPYPLYCVRICALSICFLLLYPLVTDATATSRGSLSSSYSISFDLSQIHIQMASIHAAVVLYVHTYRENYYIYLCSRLVSVYMPYLCSWHRRYLIILVQLAIH